MSEQEHYLKTELYQRFQNEPQLIDWLERGSLDGLWYWDLKNPEHEWLSPTFKATFGYGDSEIPHTSSWWQENIFEQDLPKVLENFEQHCKDPSHPYDQIVRYRHKNGSTVWVRCRGLVLFDEYGEPERMLGAHTDVTSLMETRAALEDSHADLATANSAVATQKALNEAAEKLAQANAIKNLALSLADIGIFIWHLEEDRLEWDDGMFALYHTDKSSFTGEYKDWAKHIHPKDLEDVEENLARCRATGNKLNTVFRIYAPNGDIRYIHTQAEFVHKHGEASYVLGANWDVTEEKQRELELERSNQDLTAFAYVASHDLKAPLRSIKQLAEWVEEDLTDVSGETQSNLALMRSRITRMESLLDDLLTYSRVDKATASATLETVYVATLTKEIFQFLNPPKEFELTTDANLPVFITQKTPLATVLRNLLGNAIKHRKHDNGRVSVWSIESSQRIRFFVGDNGTPIDEKHRHKIFEMFQTLKPKDKVEGSGLGLSIAKRIVENYGGEIGVLSAKDHPAEPGFSYANIFYFTWPKP